MIEKRVEDLDIIMMRIHIWIISKGRSLRPSYGSCTIVRRQRKTEGRPLNYPLIQTYYILIDRY